MKRILIIDDNPKNIQVIGSILQERNYEIEYAESGEEAIGIVRNEDFDLILMDVIMPGMNGFEVSVRIKKMEGKSEIPIIFLTAKIDEYSITQGFLAGGVDYVTKPFNANELLARVKTQIALKTSKDRLKDMNAILEQKVNERTEELRLAKEEIDVLDNAKTDFLKIISHEIRTPLNGIIGFSGLIEEALKDKQENDYLTLLNQSCNRLEQFASRAIDISELKTRGASVFNLTGVRMKLLFNNVISNLKLKVVDISLEMPDITLVGDEKKLVCCMTILLNNAVKHNCENGTISIIGKENEGAFECVIKDSGMGFPNDIINKRIKPFVSPKHMNYNPGLDLYLCKLIIEAHKGSFNVTNDNGGIVSIKIPMEKEL